MKYLWKAAALLMALCLGLGGCTAQREQQDPAAETSGGGAPAAMGRYVETEITPPIPPASGGEGIPLAVIPHGDGSLDCFLLARIPTGGEQGMLEELHHYSSPDGGSTWERKDVNGWMRRVAALLGKEALMDREPAPGEYLDRVLVRSIDMDAEGSIYCTVYGDLDTYHLMRVAPDGAVSEIPVSGWQLDRMIPRSLAVTAKSQVGVVFDDGCAALYDGEMGALLLEAREDYGVRFSWGDQPAAFSDGQIAMLDQGRQLVLYGKGVPKAFELPQQGDAVAADVNGGLYIASRKGVICLGKGMSAFETVMEGSLYQYSDPGRDIRSLRYEPETDAFYMILGSNQPEERVRLYRYVYDPDVPRKPDKQLDVVSLDESGTVRKAVLQFQMKHPDVAVSYTAYYAGDSALSDAQTEETRAEAVRALEQRLQAGDFDVALLDGVELQTYIDGGKLADLGPLPELEGCFPITGAWKQGEALWAVPARFAVSMDAPEDSADLDDTGILQMHFLRRTLRESGFQLAQEPFRPRIIAGIGADSGQKALAKEFISCMLSGEVQSADYGDGLPVSVEAFDRQASSEARLSAFEGYAEIRGALEARMKE